MCPMHQVVSLTVSERPPRPSSGRPARPSPPAAAASSFFSRAKKLGRKTNCVGRPRGLLGPALQIYDIIQNDIIHHPTWPTVGLGVETQWPRGEGVMTSSEATWAFCGGRRAAAADAALPPPPPPPPRTRRLGGHRHVRVSPGERLANDGRPRHRAPAAAARPARGRAGRPRARDGRARGADPRAGRHHGPRRRPDRQDIRAAKGQPGAPPLLPLFVRSRLTLRPALSEATARPRWPSRTAKACTCTTPTARSTWTFTPAWP